MSELSHIGKFNKVIWVGVASTFLLKSLSGCLPQPALATKEKPIECIPLSENSTFGVKIHIDESAKDKIKDEGALCKLADIVGNLGGAQGPNEILIISKDISRDQFIANVGAFMGMDSEKANHYFDLINQSEDPLGGLYARFNYLVYRESKMFVVADIGADMDPEYSLEYGLLVSLTGELAHSRPDGKQDGVCTEADVNDFPTAFAVANGAIDTETKYIRDLSETTISLTCGNGTVVETKIDPDIYEVAYNYKTEDGLTIFDLAQKALGTSATP